MNKPLAVLLASLFATGAFAASHMGTTQPEAMKSGDPKAEAAAQSKVDAKAKGMDNKAMQPEAMAQGNDKSKAKAEAKAKPKTGKKNSTDEQMKKDAAKL